MDPRENSISEKPKEDPITMKPKDNINEDSQELQGRQRLLRRKSTLFGFLVMVYDRVGNGDKLSRENFGLGRPRFHATSY